MCSLSYTSPCSIGQGPAMAIQFLWVTRTRAPTVLPGGTPLWVHTMRQASVIDGWSPKMISRGTWRSPLPRALAKQSRISKLYSSLQPSFDRIRLWVNNGCLWPSSISPVFASLLSPAPYPSWSSDSRQLYPFRSSKHPISPANPLPGSHPCRTQTPELWQHQETEKVLKLSFG